jgi:hypothetical protein
LLVLVDEQLRCDGLLEKGNDWYVQSLNAEAVSLNSMEFTGVLESWRNRVQTLQQKGSLPPTQSANLDPTNMSIAQIVGALKPTQLWAALSAAVAALVGAFALGAKLSG